MRVLITGATGYLGRALVSRLPGVGPLDGGLLAPRRARAACPARRSTATSATPRALARAAPGATPSATPRRSSASGGSGAQDFDDVNVGGLQNALDAARAAGIGRVVYTSSFLALPPTGASSAGTLERLPADEGRWPTSWRRARWPTARPLIRRLPRRDLRPGALTEGNLIGTMVSDHLAGRLPGIVGADRVWSYAWVDDVARGARRRAGARAAGRALPARRRERAADAGLRAGARPDRPCAAAPAPGVDGRRRRRARGAQGRRDRPAAAADGRHGRRS